MAVDDQALGGGKSRSAGALDAARAEEISAGVTSGTEAGLRAVLDVASSQPLDPAAVDALADLGSLDIDIGSFESLGDGVATVTAITGTPPATWSLLLVMKDGQWYLAQTEPA
ncbi:hypothetical protein [Blastococcus montanus]|uniref:hypothetical protein n=1 Tax=Blastococcus montanus TaxID=3144973 RepID=UPI00320A8772